MPPLESPITYLIYARKSSESEDRQVASIDSQIRELRAIAEREGLVVADTLSESQSAKAPGRPVFGQLLARLHQGQAQGILCWKLDRLARNPVDGGSISWMLQQGQLQRIRTHDRTYHPTDNVLMMSVEFGMANQFIRDLSVNTKRGLRAKVEQGWFPGVAKPGYLNEFHRDKGERTTPKDPQRFPLLQRAFQMMLTGVHSPRQVLDKLNLEWGYRSLKRRRLGGLPLARTTFYRILTDPFYCGRFEYPLGSGQWFQGKHEPMVTEEEYGQIQRVLGRGSRPRSQHRAFAFTGLLQCGECGAAVTAEAKTQIICGRCKLKFAASNRTSCPACGMGIAPKGQAKHLHYEYYHCTKRKNPDCSQRGVEVKELEAQISALLGTITISERMKDWFLRNLALQVANDRQDRTPILQSLEEALANCQQRLDNLLKLKISPQNTSNALLTDEEFAKQKAALMFEMQTLKQKMADAGNHADHWLDACSKTFNFACYAQAHFKNGPFEVKRTILAALGSNLTLRDKNLNVSLHKHFELVQKVQAGLAAQNDRLEPSYIGSVERKSRALSLQTSAWLPLWDDVRTLFTEVSAEALHIPQLAAP